MIFLLARLGSAAVVDRSLCGLPAGTCGVGSKASGKLTAGYQVSKLRFGVVSEFRVSNLKTCSSDVAMKR